MKQEPDCRIGGSDPRCDKAGAKQLILLVWENCLSILYDQWKMSETSAPRPWNSRRIEGWWWHGNRYRQVPIKGQVVQGQWEDQAEDSFCDEAEGTPVAGRGLLTLTGRSWISKRGERSVDF